MRGLLGSFSNMWRVAFTGSTQERRMYKALVLDATTQLAADGC